MLVDAQHRTVFLGHGHPILKSTIGSVHSIYEGLMTKEIAMHNICFSPRNTFCSRNLLETLFGNLAHFFDTHGDRDQRPPVFFVQLSFIDGSLCWQTMEEEQSAQLIILLTWCTTNRPTYSEWDSVKSVRISSVLILIM